jgi:beta-phosphoglucomutase family hydrolase
MDGVIADTAPYHFAAWREVFRENGRDYSEDMFRHNFGRRNDAIIKKVLGDGLTAAKIKSIDIAKEEGFRRLAQGKIAALPGAVDLIRALKANRFRLAIGSSAPRENIEIILSGLGIRDCFDAVVSSQDVTEGKPDPQVFQIAAQRLGVAPQDCVVIEDAVAGVAAAKGAGMHCIAVTNTHPRENLKAADLVVDSLESLTVPSLAGLWLDTENDKKEYPRKWKNH